MTINTLTLIFHQLHARRRASVVAHFEALSLLCGLSAALQKGGPRSEEGGVFWVTLPEIHLDEARLRLARLGYSSRVEALEPIQKSAWCKDRPDHLKWGKSYYSAEAVVELGEDELRNESPDKRFFTILQEGGVERVVRGYRGDGGPQTRRALPACDARLCVNLLALRPGAKVLDPFAGAGGIVGAAAATGLEVISCDIDLKVAPGLKALGKLHITGDARRLPLMAEEVDGIATEPPYDSDAMPMLVEALTEFKRVLKRAGRLVVFAAEAQRQALVVAAGANQLTLLLDEAVDRKGTPCRVMVWSS